MAIVRPVIRDRRCRAEPERSGLPTAVDDSRTSHVRRSLRRLRRHRRWVSSPGNSHALFAQQLNLVRHNPSITPAGACGTSDSYNVSAGISNKR